MGELGQPLAKRQMPFLLSPVFTAASGPALKVQSEERK